MNDFKWEPKVNIFNTIPFRAFKALRSRYFKFATTTFVKKLLCCSLMLPRLPYIYIFPNGTKICS